MLQEEEEKKGTLETKINNIKSKSFDSPIFKMDSRFRKFDECSDTAKNLFSQVKAPIQESSFPAISKQKVPEQFKNFDGNRLDLHELVVKEEEVEVEQMVESKPDKRVRFQDEKSCSVCTFLNPFDAYKCSVCESVFPQVNENQKSCSICTMLNNKDAEKCTACENPFPQVIQKKQEPAKNLQ